jgi:hypothetical protein
MKAIILATAATGLTIILAVLVFRTARIERRAFALLLIYIAVLCGLVGFSLSTPEDLWFLPADFIAKPRWLDLLAASFFYSAAFFGGILQLYNLADRGLSLRILIDVVEHGKQGATMPELFEGYSGGRGMTWMYDKRLDGMIRSGLAVVDEKDLQLTRRGEKTAVIYSWVRRRLHANMD